METCTGCGASLYAGDEWCLQCLTPVGAPAAPAAAQEAPVAEPVTAEPVAVAAGAVAAPAAPAWNAPPRPAPVAPQPAGAPVAAPPWAAPSAPGAAPSAPAAAPAPPSAPPEQPAWAQPQPAPQPPAQPAWAPPQPQPPAQPAWGQPQPAPQPPAQPAWAQPQPQPQPTWAPPPPQPAPQQQSPWAQPPPQPPPAAPGYGGPTFTDVNGVGPWVPPREGLAPGAGIGFTVAGILALGLLVQIVLAVMAVTSSAELAGIVRTGQLVIVGYYAVVLWWVVTKGKAVGFEPRWKKGPVHEGVIFGLVAGILTCTVVVMATKAMYGEIKTGGLFEFAEVNVVTVGIVLLITVVCAPVVEELLFRGLIIEAMRPQGLKWGIPVSSFLFALWHWNGQLLYYSVMGALLAAVFWKWGLFSSMACHFAFNGTLTLLTLVFILGPGETVTGQGVRVDVPGGWDTANAVEMGEIRRLEPLAVAAAVGPGGAEFIVAKETVPIPGGWSADFLLMALNSLPETEGAYRFKKESLRPVEYPAGRAAHIEIELEGREGWMVVFPRGDTLYHFVLTPHGSNRAKNDFEKMLKTVQLP